ncbi:hypothetical protein [Paraflavitalea sp. CAU 1676]|uniref:hypothetical protein n=1 Tax=Paraflavitalea sp. CAU 1676 TaxID=3032598 RepID=UPI0023DBBDB2|nr:hypothetical protein [Paraflavitalea sp. CAU 1676]MDF2192868.1 hypothetical protein [Paraflavitalea sp. CAU 1676]
MYKLLLVVLCLVVAAQASAQYIGKTRTATLRALRSSVKFHKYKGDPIEQGEHTVAMHIDDSSWYRTSFYYDFNKKGKCFRERVTTYCDTCFRKYRGDRLDKKRFDWIKVTDSLYVSKFSKQRMLETHQNGEERTIELTKIEWNQSEYDQLRNPRQR